ncbi:MAG: thioredoxin domain-containing protein, partial [Myxococcales bacterium]|nr:thioredoxin domain-containing protein [Myxococcales bacterium]
MLAMACTPRPGEDAGASPADHAGAELAWSDWGAEPFARAAAEDKLILINVVATWCHWCHVMEETTYADPQVAALLREHFVVIRVDSDARPDISERYRRWGWPATAILSPKAEPALNLRGYRDPQVFAALLRELIAEQQAGKLRAFVDDPEPAVVDEDLAAIRARAVAQLDAYFDAERLGWGDKQKYPWPDPVDHALMRASFYADDPAEARWRERALATLDAERALIDPVWGGMYQYSLRGVWDRPHYEKIAMIQAGAVGNYAHAIMINGATGDRRWLADADRITGYLLTRMQDPAGGFYTSQDADLRRPGQATVDGIDFYALDDAGRRALGEPRIDKAVYADLNGLIIHALTELDRADPNPELRAVAVRAGERMLRTHR